MSAYRNTEYRAPEPYRPRRRWTDLECVGFALAVAVLVALLVVP